MKKFRIFSKSEGYEHSDDLMEYSFVSSDTLVLRFKKNRETRIPSFPKNFGRTLTRLGIAMLRDKTVDVDNQVILND